ncbi:MAG: electron transfer flavoprotein [Chloroflexi bacterium]|jgi:electron-transferring-flavoprotein dehydrogenase|nr:electron transfer flavoprotein [Chloroflexota bacterium]MBT7081540.1 electron transfer flavoprotein [Chloroflexota bacterium]MBT7289361.1 electron transfer flavoprotein [Chloroflexota bacterium]
MSKAVGSDLNKADILFVGAGPASLAGAIKLQQLLKESGRSESVVVVEKGNKVGNHTLSGAIFDAEVLDELLPDWKQDEHPFIKKMLENEVQKDSVKYLTHHFAVSVPNFILPSDMKNEGLYTVSISELTAMLAEKATQLGVEIYTGFAARDIVEENGFVKGVKLGDKGLNQEGEKQSNYVAGEEIKANVTVFGNGCLDPVLDRLTDKFEMTKDKNPQIYSVGVKEIIKLPEENNFGSNRVIHTMGFPNRRLTPDVFGGGTIYSMGGNYVAVALIMGLDWRYCDLNPQQELQVYKSHKYVSKLIEGGEVVAYGAKTIPEGGYYSMPELVTNGAVIIGDAAGLVNIRKMKGLQYAVKSGIVAAEAIFASIQKGDYSKESLSAYKTALDDSFVGKDMRGARNYRQVFEKAKRVGVYLGAPLTKIQRLLPFRLKTHPDYKSMKKSKLKRDYSEGVDRLTDVSYSGTFHREEQPSHITFVNTDDCRECEAKYGLNPCVCFCPGEVYKVEEGKMMLSPSNCLHCKTCRVKCPYENIVWEVPEGADGPKYKVM